MKDQTNRPLHTGILVLALSLALVSLPLYAFKVSQNQDYTDFVVYYKAALRAKTHLWDQIYNLQDGASPFRYAPPWILFFRPFAELTLSQAQLFWYFCQYLWFSLGFFFIYRTLRISRFPRKQNSKTSLFLTSLSFLYVLRFCLDTLTIGQVSSFMFLGYSLGLYGWLSQRPHFASLGLAIPTSLKIGPGILYGLFFSSQRRERFRALSAATLFAITLGILPTLWLSFSQSLLLWKSWVQIVAADSQYYDASHYGSQSLNSVLLRWVKAGWITSPFAHSTQLLWTGIVCIGLLSFWLLRKPRNQNGRGLFYSLGLFAPIWFMPETFKYSLTPLAIPVAFLFGVQGKSLFLKFSLLFGGITLSLAGKDLIGDTLFFGFQNFSLPFFATVFLGISTFQAAWKESYPRRILKKKYASNLNNTIEPTQITADDWGLSPAVNRGILTLAKLGIIKRVSLMANTPYVSDGLNELKSIPGIQLGIHFNLTYGKPLSSHSLRERFTPSPEKVLIQWVNPFQNRVQALKEIREELTAQLKLLHSLDIRIQHLDGHQHIHLLPGLIEGVADLLKANGIQTIRLPYDSSLWFTSKFPILALSLLLAPTLKRHHFKSLPFIYPSLEDFQTKKRLKALVQKHPNAEILVHPAESNDIHTLEFPDSYTEGRVIEYQALYHLKDSL